MSQQPEIQLYSPAVRRAVLEQVSLTAEGHSQELT